MVAASKILPTAAGTKPTVSPLKRAHALDLHPPSRLPAELEKRFRKALRSTPAGRVAATLAVRKVRVCRRHCRLEYYAPDFKVRRCSGKRLKIAHEDPARWLGVEYAIEVDGEFFVDAKDESFEATPSHEVTQINAVYDIFLTCAVSTVIATAKREVAMITAALKAEVEVKAAAASFKATDTPPVADTTMAVVLSLLPDAVNEMETEGAEATNEDVVLEDVTLVENDDSVMEILADMTLVEDEFMSVIIPGCEETCMEDEALDRVVEIAEMLDDAAASSNRTQVARSVPTKESERPMSSISEQGFDESVETIPAQPIEAAEQPTAQSEADKRHSSDVDALCRMMTEIEMRPTVTASGQGSRLTTEIATAQPREASEQIGVTRSSKTDRQTKRASAKSYARPLKDAKKESEDEVDELCGMMTKIKVRSTVAASGEGSRLIIKITPAQLRKASMQIVMARSVERAKPTKRASTKPYSRPLKVKKEAVDELTNVMGCISMDVHKDSGPSRRPRRPRAADFMEDSPLANDAVKLDTPADAPVTQTEDFGAQAVALIEDAISERDAFTPSISLDEEMASFAPIEVIGYGSSD